MSTNQNSFLYTKYLDVLNFLSNATLYLYNAVTNSTYYNLVKNNLFPPKIVKPVDDSHVDSDNLFLENSKLASAKTVQVDTNVKMDNE
jgi:hypothetical protein